jgi:hypothetical protein
MSHACGKCQMNSSQYFQQSKDVPDSYNTGPQPLYRAFSHNQLILIRLLRVICAIQRGTPVEDSASA